MATISAEHAVVKGHHVYLSEVCIGDIFLSFPEIDILLDLHSVMVVLIKVGPKKDPFFTDLLHPQSLS